MKRFLRNLKNCAKVSLMPSKSPRNSNTNALNLANLTENSANLDENSLGLAQNEPNSAKNSAQNSTALANLVRELKTLPEKSGVYQYFNAQNRLLYVGKAKNLKHRVRSYFTFTPNLAPNPRNSLRIQKMLAECVHLEFITTDSEADALILENSFIKQLRPKYNILLRDDKTYPYIYVDLSEEYPRFELTRKLIKKPKIKYFGPFFKGARELLNALYLNFKLKQKASCKKACIFAQISRCLAPCERKVSSDEYAKIVQNATNALLNPHLLLKNLEQKMSLYAQNENYEEAAKLRDSIATIKDLEVKIHIDIAKLEDFNVFALANERNLLALVRFVIQQGKIISAQHKIFTLKDDEIDKNELYKQVILESFLPTEPLQSADIYVLDDFEDRILVEKLLSKRFGKKMSVKQAKIGEKRRICELAHTNALQNIKNHRASDKNELLSELKSFFELENLPQVIEIFDNSHMQGSANVGAMVAFKEGEFDKSSYRHYHLSHANEYEQMRELLTRRAKDFDTLSPPDLWLIDGGATLLKLADEVLRSSGANVDVLAIAKEKIDAKAHRAKGGAKDILHSLAGAYNLPVNDKKLLFLQRLRDEAHRFAISFHQRTKRKADLQSSKLKALGLTDGQIAKLLNYFGSFESIYKASFDELQHATNAKVAGKIFKKRI